MALPLLQFALREVWRKRDSKQTRGKPTPLALEAFEELGKDPKTGEKKGIEGILERRANGIFESFGPAEQEICKRIFLRLVQPGDGTDATKRRVSFDELLPTDETTAIQTWKVIEALAHEDARLITTDGLPRSGGATAPTQTTLVQFSTDNMHRGEGTIEVAHEALIQGWGRLRDWIETDQKGLRTQRRLTEAALEWNTNNREPGYLYSSARLADAREWAASHRTELNAIEVEFLALSETAHAEAAQRQAADAMRIANETQKKSKSGPTLVSFGATRRGPRSCRRLV